MSGAISTSGSPDTIQCASTLAATSAPSGAAASSICSSVPSAKSASNRRLSDNKEESSAQTQITPGAMARSWFGSAPIPSGNRLATITKKSNATATSLRRRMATSRSRRMTASTLEIDHAAVAQPCVLMGRIDDGAARARMRADQFPGQLGRGSVERGERLVEQPQRHRRRKRKPRERRAPALALRHLLQNLMGNAHAPERALDVLPRRRKAGEQAGEFQVLRGGELVLHRRRVAEVDE